MNMRPDPTFYATAKLAMEAPVETLAFTLMLSPDGTKPDGIAVVDCDPNSKSYGNIVSSLFMPTLGDEFHHFGWNACSSA
ncbi:MAG: selenium-binding protein SBP56-related protein, partial [Pseudomonadota bacterium]